MPIYEFECTKCQDEFERVQSFSDPAPKKCSKCGGRVQKKVSLSSFHLKGTGWYVTDYNKGSSANATSIPKKEEKVVEKKEAKKAEPAKAASKSDD